MQPANHKYLAGVIPVTGESFDFETVIHHSLSLVDEDYTAVERAVAECAWAGCKTIWLCVDPDVEPIIRKRIGDYVEDPVYIWRAKYRHRDKVTGFLTRPLQTKRYIPVYYISTRVEERTKLDSYGWGIVTAARAAMFAGTALSSTFYQPSRFYVAFPYGVYDPGNVREHRPKISAGKFAFRHDGETFKDGKQIGFTLEPSDIIGISKDVRAKTTRRRASTKDKWRTWDFDRDGSMVGPENILLPLSEAWSASRFSLGDVLETIEIDDYQVNELELYEDIRSWDGYLKSLTTDITYEKPPIFLRKKLSRFGEDYETDTEG